ncbi:MAG: 3'-5' exonuclease [Pseudohongiellaceae bacterium]
MVNQIIVCDLEATCWPSEGDFPIEQMETIEIGCVLADFDGHILDEFTTFVRPIESPELSDFCTELTTITQGDVDGAPAIGEAMDLLDQWVAGRDVIWGSWGNFDRKLLLSQQQRYGLEQDFYQLAHINLKRAWRRTTKKRRKNALSDALTFHGLTFEGTQHRAISDARNTARLLQFIPQGEIDLQFQPDS